MAKVKKKLKKTAAKTAKGGKLAPKKRALAAKGAAKGGAVKKRAARAPVASGRPQFDHSAMAEEIVVIASETAGDLAGLLSSFEEHGVNLKAICIPEASGMGIFRILAEPHQAALSVLKHRDIPYQTCPVLAIQLGDQPGALGRIFAILANAKITLRYVYGSVGSWGGPALLVIQIDDPAGAERALLT